MSLEHFGKLPDGREIHRVTLSDGDLKAQVLTLGATVQSLYLNGVDHSLMVGLPNLTSYVQATLPYCGAIVGRFANRIGRARFRLDGMDFETDPNFRDRHTLHGGRDGTDRQVWAIQDLEPDRVTLALTLPDGHMGFPGELAISVTIGLSDGALSFDQRATTTAPTPCSLAHHGYFDLDGTGDICRHRLQIEADHYLPVDDDLIPTGHVELVAGTSFDFRAERPIGDHPYDHNFCLSDGPRPSRAVAQLTGASGVSMQIETTACGLQFYAGAGIPRVTAQGGRQLGAFAALALETQHWPDAMNHAHFPDPILRPGDTYRESTVYRFRTRI
ncbi:galactose mutarotase [Paracoccus sp. TK19116]|uniref:Aldose 1-epimerase n=1 Tax=Paracoccus albicereus TaxID=2922394 RepID=A0ABT1MWW6_9RHOB|nr:aldose epimerase family protein [Paracoccus albicereus]MCQ0972169.1 galactose mutarotase [Paracoccus albicereus]